MSADLHVHTSFSDGTESPETVADKAKQAGLTSIAITDHDTMAGAARAMGRGVEIIPGIEFTTETPKTEIHILGFFVDENNPALRAEIDKIQHGRETRICEMCEKLAAQGAKIDPERVFSIAGHRDAGRPHVAKALVEAGFVPNFKEAFNRYIDFKGPAYVPHYKLAPEEAVKLVKAAGGVPVFAHPAISNADELIPSLVAAGLRGIEVYYPTHGQSRIQHYSSLAKKYNLLMTGGTDYHGPNSGREIELGALTVPDELVDKLKNEHLRRN
ncbi:MAG: PHP domain-containing protein [Candidatus Margulisiibacteriota bacterium]